MACSMRSGILLMALTVPAVTHWVQDLDLYEDFPGSGLVGFQAGEHWNGCVLKSCKSPRKFQNRCELDDEHAVLLGSELAQDAVFASNLGKKAAAVAALLASHSLEFKQDMKAIWANNGKGLLMGFPGNRPELIVPGDANDYKIMKAQFQQKNTACKSGKRLGELRMAVTVQEFVKQDGTYDTADKHDETTVPMLRIRIENDCLDCGSGIDKGFYLRIQHTDSPALDDSGDFVTGGSDLFYPGNLDPVDETSCPKIPKVGDTVGTDPHQLKWVDTFEFTGRKALPCGSTGSFDVLLTDLNVASWKDSNGDHPDSDPAKRFVRWPCELRITLVSPCREELAFMHLTPRDTTEAIVAPSWMGSFWR